MSPQAVPHKAPPRMHVTFYVWMKSVREAAYAAGVHNQDVNQFQTAEFEIFFKHGQSAEQTLVLLGYVRPCPRAPGKHVRVSRTYSEFARNVRRLARRELRNGTCTPVEAERLKNWLQLKRREFGNLATDVTPSVCREFLAGSN